jgi:hypothetical protein
VATLDHSPILLLLSPTDQHSRLGGSIFTYVLMWESHENFDPFLKNVWQGKGALQPLGI